MGNRGALARFDFRSFDDLVFSRMSETKLPSVAVSVIENGEVVHSRGFGYKDIRGALPATDRTLYGIGSITKSFIALSIAKLVETGKMQFNDPVTKHLPLKQKAFDGVEVHHLLSHTSGIPGLGSRLDPQGSPHALAVGGIATAAETMLLQMARGAFLEPRMNSFRHLSATSYPN
jgi:CubicO group peptidase (beta-lactamase class C family)